MRTAYTYNIIRTSTHTHTHTHLHTCTHKGTYTQIHSTELRRHSEKPLQLHHIRQPVSFNSIVYVYSVFVPFSFRPVCNFFFTIFFLHLTPLPPTLRVRVRTRRWLPDDEHNITGLLTTRTTTTTIPAPRCVV